MEEAGGGEVSEGEEGGPGPPWTTWTTPIIQQSRYIRIYVSWIILKINP